MQHSDVSGGWQMVISSKKLLKGKEQSIFLNAFSIHMAQSEQGTIKRNANMKHYIYSIVQMILELQPMINSIINWSFDYFLS